MGRTGARLSLSETVSSQEHGVMKGRASQLRGAAGGQSGGLGESREQQQWGGPRKDRAGRPQGRSPGREWTGWGKAGSMAGREGTTGRHWQRGRSSRGRVPRVSRCGLQVATLALGGYPPQRGFHPGMRAGPTRGTEWVGPGAEGSFLVDVGTRRCQPSMTGQGLGTPVTLRLGRRGLWAGKRAAFRVTGGTAWTRTEGPSAAHTVQAEACGSFVGSPVGRSGNRGDPSPVVAGPSSHCGRGRHRKGLGARGCPVPSTHSSLNPFTVRDPGALRELTTLILPSSAFPAAAAPGLGRRRQTGVRRGAGEAGRGQPASAGRGTFQENPSYPLRSPGLKSRLPASRAGAPRPGPSASRPWAE